MYLECNEVDLDKIQKHKCNWSQDAWAGTSWNSRSALRNMPDLQFWLPFKTEKDRKIPRQHLSTGATSSLRLTALMALDAVIGLFTVMTGKWCFIISALICICQNQIKSDYDAKIIFSERHLNTNHSNMLSFLTSLNKLEHIIIQYVNVH